MQDFGKYVEVSVIDLRQSLTVQSNDLTVKHLTNCTLIHALSSWYEKERNIFPMNLLRDDTTVHVASGQYQYIYYYLHSIILYG